MEIQPWRVRMYRMVAAHHLMVLLEYLPSSPSILISTTSL